jgi:hypothetical protein
MAFVKLDTGILNSTLWIERDCREVFITALLMAMPREFHAPQQQIAVRSLELTGFEVPPGWYGFVEAAGVGIVRRAMVDVEAGLAALERLGSVDQESRSKEHEGRRMIRVDGGYIVLNFMRYRDRDHTAPLRARRYRERKAAAEAASEAEESRRDVELSRRDSNAERRHITHTEAEADTEKVSDGAKAPSSSAEPTSKPPTGTRKLPEIPPPCDAIVDLYHEVLPELPRVRLRDGPTWEARRKAIGKLWRWVLTSKRADGSRRATSAEEAMQWFREYFTRARSSEWIMQGSGTWRADIDYLLSKAGIKRVVELTEAA